MHVQIVKFKLKPTTSRWEFLDLTMQMIAWLKDMEGFVAYELYEGAEFWSDRIAWESATHAEDGRNAFATTEIAKQMIPLVDSGYNSFFGEAVASS